MSVNEENLNDSNIETIIKSIKSDGIENVSYKKVDGNYAITVDDKTIAVLTSNMNYDYALNLVKTKLGEQGLVSAGDTNIPSRKNKTNHSKFNINIDLDLYLSILEDLKVILDEIANLVSENTSALGKITGELKNAYNNKYAIGEKANDVYTDVEDLNLKIDTSLQVYQNIDNNLLFGLDSLIDIIFSVGSENSQNSEYSSISNYEDRKKYLEDLILGLENNLTELMDEYQSLYGQGIEFENFEVFENFFRALGIYDTLGINDVYDGRFIDIDKVGILLDYCNTNEVFTKIKKYLNDGSSWEESGLSMFDNISTNPEVTFLRHYYENITDKTDGVMTTFSKIYGDNQYTDEDINSIKNYILQNFDFESLDTLQKKYADCREKQQDILTVKSTLYNYKQYQKLMPFESFKDDKEYLEYLQRNLNTYSSRDMSSLFSGDYKDFYNYMDQSELALYFYLNDKFGTDKSLEYLEAMKDTVNQRIGFDNAKKYVELLNDRTAFEDIFISGWEGFKDGNINFFNGLVNLVAADGVKSATDYELLYKMQLLTDEQYSEYTSNMSFLQKSFINFNYQMMSSVGNMTIPVLASFVSGGLSNALMFASSTGNATERAMQSGASTFQSYLYGTLSGASEVLLEKVIGGIPGLSNGVNFTSDSTLKTIFKNMIKEGREETIQTLIDASLRCNILGEPLDMDSILVDSVDSFFMGCVMSGVMQSGPILIKYGGKLAKVTVSKAYSSYHELKLSIQRQLAKQGIDVVHAMSEFDDYVDPETIKRSAITEADLYKYDTIEGVPECIKRGINQTWLRDSGYDPKLIRQAMDLIETYWPSMSDEDKMKIIYMSNEGSCTVASRGHIILDYMEKNGGLEKYSDKFSYNLVNSDGSANSCLLLTDLYCCLEKNYGEDAFGHKSHLVFDDDTKVWKFDDGDKQYLRAGSRGDALIRDFASSHGIDLEVSTTFLQDRDFDAYTAKPNTYVSIDCRNADYEWNNLRGENMTVPGNGRDGHSTYYCGKNKDGNAVLATWGSIAYDSFDNLFNKTKYCILYGYEIVPKH